MIDKIVAMYESGDHTITHMNPSANYIELYQLAVGSTNILLEATLELETIISVNNVIAYLIQTSKEQGEQIRNRLKSAFKKQNVKREDEKVKKAQSELTEILSLRSHVTQSW